MTKPTLGDENKEEMRNKTTTFTQFLASLKQAVSGYISYYVRSYWMLSDFTDICQWKCHSEDHLIS